ncbi:intradiol ring-cleavage dioxygenase [Rhizosaccharibacter radicis]|uniref:Intradiol ring-cleavage dioxygenase n=1 Tax=Rhizosaccharibacter radicis TaxID=2782605 RepID=A0ABT1W3N0_9PROT|nr:intradiol ring-cleavage dioxygenase [Acetobacteraceae bacterium KSS12]
MPADHMDFNELSATDIVIARNAGCPDPRLRHIMEVLVRHLHDAVRELQLTQAEWLAAIEFLTATGQICSDRRQEFILLSDTLGVSMLVDAINHRHADDATPSTVLGPFHVAGAPVMQMGETISRDGKGDPLAVFGSVRDPSGRPIENARLDVWQTSEDGFYDTQDPAQPDMNLRGVFETGVDGTFRFRSIVPASYPIPSDGPVGRMLAALKRHPMRPAHIHFIVSAPGYESLTTHIFVEGDPFLESDAVFGVKDALVLPFREVDDAALGAARGLPARHHEVEVTIRLAPVSGAASLKPTTQPAAREEVRT